MSTSTPRGDIPTRVRDERRRRGLTQRQVAEMAGISLRAYAAFEKAENVTQPKNLESILRVLPVSSPDLDQTNPREATLESWPADVRVFLDVMGAFLSTMEEPERLALIHEATRWMVGRRT